MEAEIADLAEALKGRGVNLRGHVALAAPGREALRIPAAVITGPEPGPTAWVAAGTEGDDDRLGAAAIARILPALEPTMVSGGLVATPLLGPWNPGEALGSRRGEGRWEEVEESLRAFALEALDLCDVLVIAGGGGDLLRGPLAAYSGLGTGAQGDPAALARAAGFPLLWARRRGEGGLMDEAARRGKAGVLLSLGGGGRVEEAWVVNLALALQGVLGQAGVLLAPPRWLPSYTTIERITQVAAHNGGLWRRAVEPEAPVGRGGLLGRVLDPFGRQVEAVESPAEATVLGILTRGVVAPGRPVAELGHGSTREIAPGGKP